MLVGADDSPASPAAVAFVADPTAAGDDALGTPADTWFERERARASVDRAVEVGCLVPTVVEAAEPADADHVVVWSHGHTGLSRPVLGSVAEAVVRQPSVPVTVTAAPD